MADNRQYMALEWIIRDIKDTLSQARRALDGYVRDSADIIQLKFCLTYIHQVYGSLHMSGFHGAAMIVSEMEVLAQQLLENNISHQSEAVDVLIRAIEQLPDYLEHALKAKRDQPSLVLPLLNDLRAVRDAHFLSESTLFSPNLDYAHNYQGVPHPISQNSQQLIPLVAKLRKMYQFAAASVIHKRNVEQNLEYLLKVSRRLQQILAGTKRFVVWEITEAFVTGLQTNIIPTNASIKKLLRELDEELNVLETNGTEPLADHTHDDLLKNLLYYLFSCEGSTPVIDKIRESYVLNKGSLLAPADIEGTIKTVDSSAMRAVMVAILNEFIEVKNALENCRAEHQLTCDFSAIESTFRRVADTLAILGVGHLRQEMLENISRVNVIKNVQGFPANELLEIEQSIYIIEQALESTLLESENTPSGTFHPFDEEHEFALQESRNGLEEAKDAVVNYIATQWNIKNLQSVPQLLRNVSKNLSILVLKAPAEILSACASYIELQLINQTKRPQWSQLDSLADVIASIDYFLEVLSLTREENADILKSAGNGLLSLGVPVTRVQQIMDGLLLNSVEEETSVTETPETPLETGIEETTDVTVEEPTVVGNISVEDDNEALIDDEIIEIFVEEAIEVQQTIDEYLPVWVESLDHQEALTEVRRAFHTLKGSGRLVKAMDIGELAWSVENMLNRIIDKVLVPENIHTYLVQCVCALLPELVTAFGQQKATPHLDLCEQYKVWAYELAEDKIPQALLAIANDNVDVEPTEGTIATVEEVEAVVEHDIDPQLWEIFSAEAEIHLTIVREYIAEMESAKPFYKPPSDAMQRAMHTLKGSAYMADITPIAELMKPMELFAKDLRRYQVSIDEDVLQLIKDSVTYTEEALEQIAELTYPRIEKINLFLARVAELRERSVGHLIKHEEAQTVPVVDPAILEMLMNDGMDHLLDIDTVISQWRNNGVTKEDWQSIIHELDIVKHGAERANLGSMIQLCDALLDIYQWAFESDLQPGERFYDTLLDGHYSLLAIVDAIAVGQDLPPMNSALYQRLKSLKSVAVVDQVDSSNEGGQVEDRQIEVLSESSETHVNTTTEPVTPVLETDHIADAIMENAGDPQSDESDIGPDRELTGEPELPVNSLELISESHSEQGIETAALANETVDVADEVVDEIDGEIVEIFLEEASELIEAIHAWENGGNERVGNEALQRLLHTFKGGARLAGLIDIGDLAHNFESYLISQYRSKTSDTLMESIHQYQDQLIQYIDALSTSPELPELSTPSSSAELSPELSLPDTPTTSKNVETENHRHGEISVAEEERIDVGLEASIGDLTDKSKTVVNEVAGPLRNKTEGTDTVQPDVLSSNDDNVVPFTGKAEVAPAVKPTTSITFPGFDVTTSAAPAQRVMPQEMVKVSANLMEELVNLAGETSISRGRMEQQINDMGYSLEEMGTTVERLQEQLRRLDIETEAQVIFRQEQLSDRDDFDPLEMDRYSQLQQLSRSLIESASDLIDLKSTLSDKARDAETVLLQQSRINTELQEGLMRSRMVPFSRLVPRLRRIVRQISNELGKDVVFESSDTEGELDRNMMERMVAPLEHMLRNAVDHGIEPQPVRQHRGKPAAGRITLSLEREGGNILLVLSDDGAGIDVQRTRQKAIERQLMSADAALTDQEILQFIFRPGFSTAETVTQISGRGVGMDVVSSEIKQLGGSIEIHSREGQGTVFSIRLPFTVSVNRALMISMGDDGYAVPLNAIEGIARIHPDELPQYYEDEDSDFEYAGTHYQLKYLGSLLDAKVKPKLTGHTLPVPVLLVRSASHAFALQVDSLQGSREIVVKSLGAQFSAVQGLAGATIMGDGHVVVILDVHAMIRQQYALSSMIEVAESVEEMKELPAKKRMVMVVDDSVTVRKVTTRFLEREGYDVMTAKDGVDAMQILQNHTPDVMLLDIEMPRMDGFEVAKRVRISSHLADLPIIMITSRTGEKHRQTGLAAGATYYMGKPYQEAELLANIRQLFLAES
ncbi:hypothetical protein AB835_02940 [Candidatus Endobugula sertula]|uniref:Chemotaxis protein CheA n=1 Tax=Candidatus Endobugula sertula TaxID=62101 RepID=A0A1D2QSI5_9GAMM|nr:hypothetical protein AB835_02940 [Candidatus Endobugula sertula]